MDIHMKAQLFFSALLLIATLTSDLITVCAIGFIYLGAVLTVLIGITEDKG